jgi:hypothetical protein
MTLFRRPPAEVRALTEPGERALAWAVTSEGGWLVATDDRLRCSAPLFDHRWVEILGASWKEPQLQIKVRQAGEQEDQGVRIEDADVLPQVIRERIMQSLLVQQHVALAGTKGVRFLARRDPKTDAVTWQTVVDAGIDPSDPRMRERIDESLVVLRDAYGV